MKTFKMFRYFAFLFILLHNCRTTTQQENAPCAGTGKEYYSAAEMDGVVCGYSINRECLNREQDKEVLYQTANITLKLSILGQGVDIKNIPDFQQLAYMKVRAVIESVGELITVESLNRPGQKFTGNVTDNRIEGIFETEPARFNGENAPTFPPHFSDNVELKKYHSPERLIESDDPVLVEEAGRITAGSKDSWEAVIRLSKWVSENIEGAIPGGTSAINTYKTRQGECGSHSRLLAAFCRALGIPARLSLGCLYTPHYNGSFGQHAWTEVYMGDAEWIPVDATIFESGFIDAGHIRLGESATFQPIEMEILDYRLSGDKKIQYSICFTTGN